MDPSRISDAPLENSWSAAVHLTEHDNVPLGAALVLDRHRVLTASHVVGESVENELWVAFPKVSVARRRVASVSKVGAETNDMSLLSLAEPAPGAVRTPRLRYPAADALRRLRWWAFGFPDGDVYGDSAYGWIGESLNLGWIRLDHDSRYGVRTGFSGGGLWCPDYEAVVGIVGQANAQGDGRALTFDWLIGDSASARDLSSFAAWSPGDAGTLAMGSWGWRIGDDREASHHWGPRARGVLRGTDAGFRFQGRRTALQEIVDWIAEPSPARRILIVTGSPGAGKSAVLGRIITTADRSLSALLPSGDSEVRAARDSIDAAVYARGKTALEVAREVARSVSGPLPTRLADIDSVLRDGLLHYGRSRFTLIIDGLDEASTTVEGERIIQGLVVPLIDTCSDLGVRVLLGARRSGTSADPTAILGDSAQVIDLDETEYFAFDDLAAYSLLSLQATGRERADSPYLTESSARLVATSIAERAGKNFLIAGLVARDRGLSDKRPARPDELAITPSLELALLELTDRLKDFGAHSATDALTALAFAEAPGVISRHWAILVESLTGLPADAADLERFAGESGASFVVEDTQTAEEPVFRLFHQALNDALLARRSRYRRRYLDERVITRALLSDARLIGWNTAPDYTFRSLPGHASRSGLVDELLLDDEFLLRADLLRLLPVAELARTGPGRLRARLLKLTPDVLRSDGSQRAALLSVTNALNGLHSEVGPVPGQPYRGRWAATRPRTELATVGRHPSGWVTAVCAINVADRVEIASAGDDGTVRLWDPSTGGLTRVLEGHVGSVLSVCAWSNGAAGAIISADEDGAIRIWDASSASPTSVFRGHEGAVLAVCVTDLSSGPCIVSGGADGTVRTWDFQGNALAVFVGHDGPVLSLCGVKSGGPATVVSGGADGTVRVWNVDGGPGSILEGHHGAVLTVASGVLDEHQVIIASGGADGTVRLWREGTEFVAPLVDHSGPVFSLCALDIGGRCAFASAGSDGTVRLWTTDGQVSALTLDGYSGPVLSVEALWLGRALIASAGADGTIRLWDPETATRQQQPDATGDAGPVKSVCASRQGDVERVVSGGNRGVAVWHPETGDRVFTLEGHAGPINAVCGLDGDGDPLLASGGADATIRLWNVETHEQRCVLYHAGPVNSVCQLRVDDGVLMASGGADSTIRIWDVGAQEQRLLLDGHAGPVNSVCEIVTDGRHVLASAGADSTVRVWDIRSGEQRLLLDGHVGPVNSVCAIRVDGRRLLASAGADSTVRLWDLRTGEEQVVLGGHAGPVNSVCEIRVDARHVLASGSADGNVRIWDPAMVHPDVVVPTGYVVLAIAPVNGHLAVGLTNGVLVLDIPGMDSGRSSFRRAMS